MSMAFGFRIESMRGITVGYLIYYIRGNLIRLILNSINNRAEIYKGS